MHQFLDRPYLDRAEEDCWYVRCELDRLIQVLRFDQDKTADLFLGLRERSIGDRYLPAPNPHRGSGVDGLERLGRQEVTSLPKGIVIFKTFVIERLSLGLGHGLQSLFVYDDHEKVLHSASQSSATRRRRNQVIRPTIYGPVSDTQTRGQRDRRTLRSASRVNWPPILPVPIGERNS